MRKTWGVTSVFAEPQAAMKEFNVAQQNQERVRRMLHDTRESLDIAFMDMQESMSKFKDSRDLHDMVCRDLQDAGTRFNEAKRKADDAQDQVPGSQPLSPLVGSGI